MSAREEAIKSLESGLRVLRARFDRREELGGFEPRGAAELDDLAERIGEDEYQLDCLMDTTDEAYDAERARVQAIWDAEDAAYRAERGLA